MARAETEPLRPAGSGGSVPTSTAPVSGAVVSPISEGGDRKFRSWTGEMKSWDEMQREHEERRKTRNTREEKKTAREEKKVAREERGIRKSWLKDGEEKRERKDREKEKKDRKKDGEKKDGEKKDRKKDRKKDGEAALHRKKEKKEVSTDKNTSMQSENTTDKSGLPSSEKTKGGDVGIVTASSPESNMRSQSALQSVVEEDSQEERIPLLAAGGESEVDGVGVDGVDGVVGEEPEEDAKVDQQCGITHPQSPILHGPADMIIHPAEEPRSLCAIFKTASAMLFSIFLVFFASFIVFPMCFTPNGPPDGWFFMLNGYKSLHLAPQMLNTITICWSGPVDPVSRYWVF